MAVITTISIDVPTAVVRLQEFDQLLEIHDIEDLLSDGYEPIETLIGSQIPEDPNVVLQLQVVQDTSGSYYIKLSGKYSAGWNDEITHISELGSDLTETPVVTRDFQLVPKKRTIISAFQDMEAYRNTEYTFRVLFLKEGVEEGIIGEYSLTHQVDNDFSLATSFITDYYGTVPQTLTPIDAENQPVPPYEDDIAAQKEIADAWYASHGGG